MAKIVRGYPPNYPEIRAAFNPPATTVYAYGDTIYSPSTATLPAHLIVHESVYLQQQRCGGPEAWWRRYIDEPQFRLEQEIEAYRAQYESVTLFPRAQRRKFLAHICGVLASGLYGKIVTKDQARQLIAGAVAA